MKRVLIVDDFEQSRAIVKAVVRHPDRQILEAPDGVEALKVMAAHEVDLVLTDGQMPRMDGLELMRRLRDQDPELPVILVSAYGDIAMAVEAVQYRRRELQGQTLDRFVHQRPPPACDLRAGISRR